MKIAPAQAQGWVSANDGCSSTGGVRFPSQRIYKEKK